MEIKYQASGGVRKTTASDENLTIKEETRDGHTVITVTAVNALTLMSAEIILPHIFAEEDLIFANGYQGWTESREFARYEHLRNLNKAPGFIEKKFHFKQYGSQSFRPMEKNIITAFDYGYIKGSHPFFIGSNNFKNAYLIIDFSRNPGWIKLSSDISGRPLKAGEEFTLFDYVTADYIKLSLEKYFDSFPLRSNRKLLGYTSWYNYYQKINENIIYTALDAADMRFELFQIDDGWERYIGDWMDVDPKKFPHGLEPIVEAIHGRGMMAGLWLAPFVAEKKSKLMKEHPDWIARQADGTPIWAGCNWSGDCALDLSNADVVTYIKDVLKTYANMGFDFFKLDFIYAANLSPLNGKTRAETAEYAYNILRNALGSDKLILGCGAILSNGFGKFDYMRVGPDVSLSFDDAFYMKFFHPERVSTKVTIQNTIYRSPMNGRAILNDPDVFLLRDNNISLSEDQRFALAMINALFGSLMMTSDNIKAYEGKQKRRLERAMELFKSGEVTDYERVGDEIRIDYTLDGIPHFLAYNTEKGVIIDDR